MKKHALRLSEVILALTIPSGLAAQDAGEVLSETKISDTQGSFGGTLVDFDTFGFALSSLGDMDGDGVSDLAVGASRDDDGGFGRGAVWILFLNADGTVKSEQKISDTQGGFGGTLADSDSFGSSLASPGDLDGDGVPDLAVGATGDDDGGSGRGAVWVLFLNANGTVKSEQKISATQGGFTGLLSDADLFGGALTVLGDLDDDGLNELAVGAVGDDDGGTSRGAAWVLFLTSSGTVKANQKISDTSGGFFGTLDDLDFFGAAVAGPGDVDGDGVPDLAVGSQLDDDGSSQAGAIWMLLLNSSGTVKSHQKISATAGGFTGTLAANDFFGTGLAGIGDWNGDGTGDLAAASIGDDDGGSGRGAVWILFLASDGSVVAHEKISSTSGGFGGTLDDNDGFGSALAALGDLDGDRIPELAIGTPQDDDGGSDRGAVWITEHAPGAGVLSRNGSGSNPSGYIAVNDPVLGTSWSVTVDIATPGASLSVVGIVDTGPLSATIGSGEVLVDVSKPFLGGLRIATGSHSFPIGTDLSLYGLRLYTQAATYAPGDVRLQNALDVQIGFALP